MTLRPLGDSAWLVEFPPGTRPERVMGLAAALGKSRPAGVLDVVPSFSSLAVHYEAADGHEIRDWIEAAMAGPLEFESAAAATVEIPVRYDGADLEAVAEQTRLTPTEVIELHSGADYTVAAVGFSPGFPYLSGLPERLNVPRRSTPRLVVPAGSVAIAGGQAGIYPFESPGGWHLLGTTALRLFDPGKSPPALLQPGDRVRFVPVESLEFPAKPTPTFPIAAGNLIEVIHPGGFTTIQDLGRPGHETSGVSPGGAADRQSLRFANLSVGNDEGAACLEICVSGPVLKFHTASVVALCDETAAPRRVEAGEIVDFSRLRNGVRAYLAVSGGLRIPGVLGSASTDTRGGFGGFRGRALLAGDVLEVGETTNFPRIGNWHIGRGQREAEIELRYLSGMQTSWFADEARRNFSKEIYEVTPASDRMGARLSGNPLELASPREMVSQPVACGSVQVPPDGQPIVLLAGRQTIGGYPQIGHVISVDLPKLARAWPGTRVRFREVTLEEAWELKRREQRDLTWLRTGLELLKSPRP